MINKIKVNIPSLSLMLIIPVINIFYAFLNNSSRGVYDISIGLDNLIPFSKIFIIPYIIWYPFMISTLVYFCFRDKEIYHKMIISLILGLLLSYAIFFLFQTGIERPVIEQNDILSKLVKFIYKTDNPYNCFPSIHVFTSYLMIKGIVNCKAKNTKSILIVSFTATIIILSTLFVKQHLVWDVIGGIILAEIVFKISKIYKMLFNMVSKKIALGKTQNM
ncbi:phosphatase PAP2 family protein [Clostridium aestuarii]|uniref:Phosphatase PAP2 family protein n=1 Tax=Clostridium aestuarii TaxID=338193 RepID=A0ABT4CZG0_9CLOT|nr:phosphatase PAP2 family protein [Clostridium aestuarii]MCY6484212.1 phosphatase PAP2 family protein [Clostridium aestuarii]